MIHECPLSFAGKRILVTGASSGIGRETAILLSRLGAKVVLLARNQDRLQDALSNLSGDGHAMYSFDLSQVDEIPRLMKQIAHEQGKLSGLFHAAGIEKRLSVRIIKQRHIDEVLMSSLNATFLLSKGFVQKNVRDVDSVGSIVIMSSVAGLRGKGGLSVYSASKAAIDGAVRSLACELADLGIRVNSIAAGMIETEMTDRMAGELSKESMENLRNRHLFGFGSSQDVANAAAFLLSDMSRWITGTVMVVDGGYTCQ